MSPPAHHTAPPTEPDDAPYGHLVIGLVIVLVIFGAAVLAAWFLQEPRPERRPDIPQALGSPEIGSVLQTLFERDHRAWGSEQQKRERLNGWGWVDPASGLAHIPIEDAMELIVERHASAADGESDGGIR